MRFSTILLAFFALPVAAVPLTELVAQRDELLSEKNLLEISQQDDLLARWLTAQKRITDNLAEAIQKDALRADSLAGDFQFLLSQYRTEIDNFRKIPAFNRKNALNVKDFGAKADGVTDDGPAIRNAIAAAVGRDIPNRAVFIPKGHYRLGYDPQRPGSNLYIHDVEHLLIFGEDGTELLIPQPLAVPVQISSTDDVRLENLRVTFTKRPFTTGVVKQQISDDTLRCEIDNGMADPTDDMFKACQFKGLMRFYSAELNPDSRRPARSSILPHQGAPDVTKVGERLYDFKMKNFLPLKGYTPGIRFAFYARTYGNHAVSSFNTTRLRLVNIHLNSSSAMAFCLINADRPFIAGCTVEADPDTFVSTSADGIYLRGGAVGGLLYNNTIRHIGDDFVNIHSLLSPAFDGADKRLILKKQWFKQYLKTGVRIGLIPVSQGINEPTIEGRIALLEENEHNYVANLDVSFGNLVTHVRRCTVKDFPKADFLVLLDDLCHGLVIQNNRFEYGLSRFLAGGRNWLFTENTVEDSLQHTYFMNICPEPGGHEDAEFALPRNIEISHNTFKTLAKSLFNGGTSVNQFRPINHERPTASHIKITNNDIHVWGSSDRPLINMKDTAFLTIENNRIVNTP